MTLAAERAILRSVVAGLSAATGLPLYEPNGPDPRPTGQGAFVAWERGQYSPLTMSMTGVQPRSGQLQVTVFVSAGSGDGVLSALLDEVEAAIPPGKKSLPGVGAITIFAPTPTDATYGDPFPDVYGRGLVFPFTTATGGG